MSLRIASAGPEVASIHPARGGTMARAFSVAIHAVSQTIRLWAVSTDLPRTPKSPPEACCPESRARFGVPAGGTLRQSRSARYRDRHAIDPWARTCPRTKSRCAWLHPALRHDVIALSGGVRSTCSRHSGLVMAPTHYSRARAAESSNMNVALIRAAGKGTRGVPVRGLQLHWADRLRGLMRSLRVLFGVCWGGAA